MPRSKVEVDSDTVVERSRQGGTWDFTPEHIRQRGIKELSTRTGMLVSIRLAKDPERRISLSAPFLRVIFGDWKNDLELFRERLTQFMEKHHILYAWYEGSSTSVTFSGQPLPLEDEEPMAAGAGAGSYGSV